MNTLYRFGRISAIVVILILLDYTGGIPGIGTSTLSHDEHDEIEFYTLMGFERTEWDW
jgi:hypothetical protein